MKKINTTIYGLVFAASALLLLTVGCTQDGGYATSDSGGVSQGGSMARFTVVGDYMYTVDEGYLHVVSLAVPDKPFEVGKVKIGFDIETIFPLGDKLFIGSRSAMFIYDISSPEDPYELGRASHFTSCDPVVASGNYAFVTLNSIKGQWCNVTGDNTLQVYDITNLQEPVLMQVVNLISPDGLAVDGEAGLVFVCDGGLVKAFRIDTTPSEEGLDKIKLTKVYSTSTVVEVRGMKAYDCIAMGGSLLVTGDDGIYQLGYDQTGFSFISKIDLR
jgi:hypothetical protein